MRHFQGTEQRNYDLVQVYRNYFEKCVNPVNLALFIDSYVRRSDLNITRDMDTTRRRDSNVTLSMPIMNITGAYSPHVDDTVTLNGRLDPTNSSWMKVSPLSVGCVVPVFFYSNRIRLHRVVAFNAFILRIHRCFFAFRFQIVVWHWKNNLTKFAKRCVYFYKV